MRIVDRWIVRAVFVALFAALAGCGAPPGIVRPEEPTRTARIFTVTSPIEWGRYKSYNAELWTIDGTALNRILWLVNIRDKYHVFGSTRATKRRPDGPFYRNGMDASEIVPVPVPPNRVLGDFNCEPDSSSIAPLFARTRLQPAANVPSFPSWQPSRCIDQVLTTAALDVRRYEVLPLRVSDHLPVAVDVHLPDACVLPKTEHRLA